MKPIYHFFHCYFKNHWSELVVDHINNLILSGLYDRMESMTIGCVGSEENLKELQDIIAPLSKITIGAYSDDPTEYEFITLKLLKDKCLDNPDAYVYYSHSKGVSYDRKNVAYTGGRCWFDYMEHFNCVKWKDAERVLDFGYDCYGVKAIPQRVSPSEKLHYSGNSWWAKADYVNSWERDIDTTNRFNAEMECGQGNPILFTACQLFIDYICTTPFKTLQEQGHVKQLL